MITVGLAVPRGRPKGDGSGSVVVAKKNCSRKMRDGRKQRVDALDYSPQLPWEVSRVTLWRKSRVFLSREHTPGHWIQVCVAAS